MTCTQVEKYGAMVWQDQEMDTLRKKRCLCLNCKRLGQCDTASDLLAICKAKNMAMAITRCQQFSHQAGQ